MSEYDEETIGDAVDQAMHDADKAISDFADRGIAFAINVKNYHRPQKQLATFPAEFLKNYTGLGYSLMDPVFHWAMSTNGSARWSEIQQKGLFRYAPKTVQNAATSFGMRYGAIIATRPFADKDLRSFLSAARSDREFTDYEIDELARHLENVQSFAAPLGPLTRDQQRVLSLIAGGSTQEQVTQITGFSRSKITRLLAGAQDAFGTSNQTSTIARAAQMGLIIEQKDAGWW